MELKDAQRQACKELGFEFESLFRRGRPSLEQTANKAKVNLRAAQLMDAPVVTATQKKTVKGEVLRDALVDVVKTGGSDESKAIVSKTRSVGKSESIVPLRRIAEAMTTPLHTCTFDVDLATVPMKVLEKSVPDFLKKRKHDKS